MGCLSSRIWKQVWRVQTLTHVVGFLCTTWVYQLTQKIYGPNKMSRVRNGSVRQGGKMPEVFLSHSSRREGGKDPGDREDQQTIEATDGVRNGNVPRRIPSADLRIPDAWTHCIGSRNSLDHRHEDADLVASRVGHVQAHTRHKAHRAGSLQQCRRQEVQRAGLLAVWLLEPQLQRPSGSVGGIHRGERAQGK